jgi:ammonium transporter, Amt family
VKRWMPHLSLLLLLVGTWTFTPPAYSADEPAPTAVAADAAAPAPAEPPKSEDLVKAEAALAEKQKEVSDDTFRTNNLWMMLCTGLVFIMHLGFATVETGLTRSKNTVNILFKNTLIPCIGLLTYAIIGFNLMYPGADFAGKYFGFSGFGVGVGGNPEDAINNTSQVYNAGYTYWTDFLFQGMFAATAATIVSGAVAERIKLSSSRRSSGRRRR